MQTIYRALIGFSLICSTSFVLASDEALSVKYASFETWIYGTKLGINADSLLNPGNRVARLPDELLTADAKLNLALLAPNSEITIRSNFLKKYSKNSFETVENFDVVLSQGYMRTALGKNFSATAGRELFTWGPAYFRSPSNPFYFDAGRTDPLRDLPGLDLAKLFYTDGSLGITAGYIAGSGKVSVNPDFSGTTLLKIDSQGKDYLLSLVACKSPDHSGFIGGFGQTLARDDLLIYGEFGYGNRANTVQAAQPPSTFLVVRPTEKKHTILIGGAYTTGNGQTLAVEYMHNASGLSRNAHQQYFDIVESARNQFNDAQSPSSVDMSEGTLATALGNAPAPLSKDYLFLLWQSNPAEESTYWRFTSAANLNDRSSQLTGYVEKNISDKVSIFGIASKNIGGVRTEYGALTSYSFVFGLKIFMF